MIVANDWGERFAASSLTTRIVALTVIVWAVVAFTGAQNWAFGFGGFIPLRFDDDFVLPGALPAIATPLSAALLHADILHLLFNMFMLIVCGRAVERAIGAAGLGALYVVGAYSAALGHYMVHMSSAGPMIGASGAVSAVIGAYAILYSKRREGHGGMRHVLQLAGAWIVLQLLIGLTNMGSPAPIAIAAHIVGFVAGLLLARPLLLWRYRDA